MQYSYKKYPGLQPKAEQAALVIVPMPDYAGATKRLHETLGDTTLALDEALLVIAECLQNEKSAKVDTLVKIGVSLESLALHKETKEHQLVTDFLAQTITAAFEHLQECGLYQNGKFEYRCIDVRSSGLQFLRKDLYEAAIRREGLNA